MDLRLFTPQRSRVEAAYPVLGSHPEDSGSSFDQVINAWVGQAVFDAIGGELVTVEAAQPVTGAEPEETMRVTNDAQNKVARQTVGSRVGSRRQLLGLTNAWREQKQAQQEHCAKGGLAPVRDSCSAADRAGTLLVSHTCALHHT